MASTPVYKSMSSHVSGHLSGEVVLSPSKFAVQEMSSNSEEEEIIYPEGTVEIASQRFEGKVILEEFDEVTQDAVIYKEVPVYHTKRKYVVKRTQEIERKIVEKPVYEYIDQRKEVKVIKEIEVVKEVPVVKIIETAIPITRYETRDIEKVRYVPVETYKDVERVIEVPGPVQIVPKTVEIEKILYNDVVKEHEVPVVVAQTVHPILSASTDQHTVQCRIYEPNVIASGTRIPKPVDVDAQFVSCETHYRRCEIDAPLYNTMVRTLNDSHVIENAAVVPFVRHEDGEIYFIDGDADIVRLPKKALLDGYEIESFSSSSSSVEEVGTAPSLSKSKSKSKSRSRSQSVVHTHREVQPVPAIVSVEERAPKPRKHGRMVKKRILKANSSRYPPQVEIPAGSPVAPSSKKYPSNVPQDGHVVQKPRRVQSLRKSGPDTTAPPTYPMHRSKSSKAHKSRKSSSSSVSV